MLGLPPPSLLTPWGGPLGSRLSEAKEGRPQGLPWRPASGFLLGLVNPLIFQKRALSGGWPQARKLG